MDLSAWIAKIWNALAKELGAVLAGIIITLALAAFAAIVRFFVWLIDYHWRLWRVRRDIARDTTGSFLREGRGIWAAPPIRVPVITHRTGLVPKVLVVANAKGGVGKTTVAANVAACLSGMAEDSGQKPVLLVDLDFQGTLSAMSVADDKTWLPTNDRDSDASYLISGDWEENDVADYPKNGQ